MEAGNDDDYHYHGVLFIHICFFPEVNIWISFSLASFSLYLPLIYLTELWNPSQKGQPWGFPGGAVVENLPANAGDTGSSSGLGRSHMQQSNWAREPQLLSLRVWSLCSATRGRDSERPAHRDEEWPPLATTRESPCTETKTQHSHKLIN